MTASAQFTRIVSLVAELTRREREGDDAATIGELAEHHGVSERDINADIRALTILTDHVESDWLLSLRVWQQGEEVSITSQGPFRRPVRLSPEEQLAIQVALALDPGGSALATRLAALWSGVTTTTPATGVPAEPTGDIIRRAVREHLTLVIDYAGEGKQEVTSRTIQPHQVVESGIRTYVVAWAEDVGAWRHFRLDRIASVMTTDRRFDPRNDFTPLTEPRDTFRGKDSTEHVTVRFRREAAPWVTEYFAEHEVLDNGSVQVTFEASSPEWLIRRVLEFGADAEVVGPSKYRDAMQRAVA